MKKLIIIFAFLLTFTASIFAQSKVALWYIDKLDTTLVTNSPLVFAGNSSTWGGALTVQAPSAGTLGQLYVSGGASAVPSWLGQGNSGDILISGGAGANAVFTTAHQFTPLPANDSNTTTSMAKSPLSFVAAANGTYHARWHIKDSVSAATGLTFDIYALSAIGSINGTIAGSKKSDTCGFGSIVSDSTASSAFTTYVPTTNYGVQDIDIIFVNGAASQTVWLRYAKPTSGTAILKPGSYVDVWKQ